MMFERDHTTRIWRSVGFGVYVNHYVADDVSRFKGILHVAVAKEFISYSCCPVSGAVTLQMIALPICSS